MNNPDEECSSLPSLQEEALLDDNLQKYCRTELFPLNALGHIRIIQIYCKRTAPPSLFNLTSLSRWYHVAFARENIPSNQILSPSSQLRTGKKIYMTFKDIFFLARWTCSNLSACLEKLPWEEFERILQYISTRGSPASLSCTLGYKYFWNTNMWWGKFDKIPFIRKILYFPPWYKQRHLPKSNKILHPEKRKSWIIGLPFMNSDLSIYIVPF